MSETVDPVSGNITAILAPEDYFSYGLRDVFLSAFITEAYMDGIYTMLFLYTAATILIRPKFISKHKFLVVSLLLLYIFNVIHLAVNWVFTRESYVINGTTRDDVVLAFEDEPLWQNMTSSTVNAASTLVADAIIVWRVWVIWGKNWRAIVLPIILYLAEIAMGVYSLVNTAVQISTSNVTADPSTIFLAFSLVTTVICTALIVFRIVRLGYQSADSPYRNVIEIIVESAFLYSISLILFLPLYVQTDLRLNFMSEYLKRIVFAMTGIAPTLIVARVAMGVARKETSWSQQGTGFTSGAGSGSRTRVTNLTPVFAKEQVETGYSYQVSHISRVDGEESLEMETKTHAV